MKLTVLTDNAASKGFLAEHGLSYYIEYDIKLLFDTGQTDVFIQNAKKMGAEINNVDSLVLSHGHYDHGNGLEYLNNKKLICHPEAFIKRFRKGNDKNIGLSLDENELKSKFQISVQSTPLMITNRIFFLGEIPRLNDFESKHTDFVKEDGFDDFVIDDSALAVRTKKGLVVVSGCGHSGICNIIEYAKNIMSEKRVYAVIGGFHLKENDATTKRTIEYFKKEKIQKIYPSHCTELPALAAFYNEFEITQLKTGDEIVF